MSFSAIRKEVNGCVQCCRCLQMKDLSDFYRRKDRPIGIDYKCKKCVQENRSKINYLPQNNGIKKCSKCYKNLSLTEFEACKNKKDGRASQCKKCRHKYKMHRLNTVPELRITENLRRRTRAVLEGINKSKNTLMLLGCDMKFLRKYIEGLFKDGMSWENYGEWQIDHIIPCSKFDLTKESEQQKCFHYTNLQPLWKEDNLSKGNKII